MKIKGSGDIWVVGTIVVGVTLGGIGKGTWLNTLFLLWMWLLFYGLFIWVRDIEITENQIRVRRLFRTIVIDTHHILSVSIKKHTVIINKSPYTAVNFYKYQIKKSDLSKLLECLEKYVEK